MKEFDLTVKDADDFLEHLYGRLKRQGQGLSLLEPALLVLNFLRKSGAPLYIPHRERYAPIVMDALISGTCESFGYDGLAAAAAVAGDIPLLSQGYIPENVGRGLDAIRRRLAAIEAALEGNPFAHVDFPGGARKAPAARMRERTEAVVMLPLVSLYRVGGDTLSAGRVVGCRVVLRITGEASLRRRQAPVVTFEHIFAEPGCPFERQIHTAVAAAERMAAAGCQSRLLARLPREYLVTLPEIATLPASAAGTMSGASAGLAFAVLIMTAVCRLDLGRIRLRDAGDTAFTGEIDAFGAVLPVSESLVGEKVRAVFYSTCRRLVVPSGNLPAAQGELARLARRHPGRRLEIVAAESAGEVFGDQSMVERRRVALARPLLQRTFFWRKQLIVAAATLAAALVSLFVAPAYLDREAASAVASDSLVIMYNSHGRRIATHNTGHHRETSGQAGKYIFVGDIDGSGVKHVVHAIAGKDDRFEKYLYDIRVLVFSSRGRLLRETQFSSKDIIGQIEFMYTHPKSIRMSTRMFYDRAGDGHLDLFVNANHVLAPPSMLMRFSLQDTTWDAFLHNGYLRGLAVLGSEGNRRAEMVLTGYNADLESAVVIVLDSAHLQGASPAGARFEVAGFEEDVAKHYIRLPRSDLQYPYLNPNMELLCELIKESGWHLSVLSKSAGIDIAFHFDENLVCREAEITQFPPIKHGHGRGRLWDLREKIDQDFYRELLADLVAGVSYWDGENWRSEPAINSSYERLTAARPAGGEPQ